MTILGNLFNKIQGKPEEELFIKYGEKILTLNTKLKSLDALMNANTPEQGLMSIVGFIRLIHEWNLVMEDKDFKNLLKKIDRINATETDLKLLSEEFTHINTLCKEIVDSERITVNKTFDGLGNISTQSVLVKISTMPRRTVAYLQKIKGPEEREAGVFCANFINKYKTKIIESTEKIKVVLEKNTVTT